MIRIYIVRHGETTWNEAGRIQGRSDPELSPKGREQSLSLLSQLKDRPLSAVYTSHLQRSISTAQPIAGHFGLPIQKQAELNEFSFGILEGKYLLQFSENDKEEWERFKADQMVYRMPGSENLSDVAARLKPFEEKILLNHPGQEILVVGHKIVNRLLIGMLLEYSAEETPRLEQGNGCIYLIERDGEPRVFHFMDGKIKEGFFFAPPPAISGKK